MQIPIWSFNTMHKVTFKFENSEDVTVFAAFGESLLEVARKTNVAIDAPCSGNAACGKCKVKLMEGDAGFTENHAIFQMKSMRKAGDWPVSARSSMMLRCWCRILLLHIRAV